MWLGYEDYPNTYLRDDEKQIQSTDDPTAPVIDQFADRAA